MNAIFKFPETSALLEVMATKLLELRLTEAALTNALINLGKAHPSIPVLKTEMLRARLAADEFLTQKIEGVCLACLRGSEPRVRDGQWIHIVGGVIDPYAEEPCTGTDEFRNIISQAADNAIDEMFEGLVPNATDEH
jgi:hypothetical protein